MVAPDSPIAVKVVAATAGEKTHDVREGAPGSSDVKGTIYMADPDATPEPSMVPSSIVDGDTLLVMNKPVRVGTGVLQLGENNDLAVSHELVTLKVPNENRLGAVLYELDPSNPPRPFYWDEGAEAQEDIVDAPVGPIPAGDQNITVATTQLTGTGTFLIKDITVRPNSTGVLSIKIYRGTDDTGDLVRDFLITVGTTPGNDVSIPLPAPMIVSDESIHLEFSGIQVQGNTQSGGVYDGQTVPRLRIGRSSITKIDLINDVISNRTPAISDVIASIEQNVPIGTNLTGRQVNLRFAMAHHEAATSARIVGFTPGQPETVLFNNVPVREIVGVVVNLPTIPVFANAGDSYVIRVQAFSSFFSTVSPVIFHDFIITAVNDIDNEKYHFGLLGPSDDANDVDFSADDLASGFSFLENTTVDMSAQGATRVYFAIPQDFLRPAHIYTFNSSGQRSQILSDFSVVFRTIGANTFLIYTSNSNISADVARIEFDPFPVP